MWVLMGGIALLQMWKIPAGFLTNHGADILLPGYLYVILRRRDTWLGLPLPGPFLLASAIFTASLAWEWGQEWGLDPVTRGRFDPWDVVSYAVSVAAAYAGERWWARRNHDG